MLNILSDREIREKYRLSRQQISDLHDLTEEDIKPKTMRSHAIPAMTKLNLFIMCNKFVSFPMPVSIARRKYLYDRPSLPYLIGLHLGLVKR